MNRVCIDTSAYSHYRRGEPVVTKLLDGAREVGVPAIVLGELRAGFRRGRHRDRNEQELSLFLGQPVVQILEVDEDVATYYAEIWDALRRTGRPIPTNDLWIAAVSANRGATLLTYDQHFAHVSSVGVRVLDAG